MSGVDVRPAGSAYPPSAPSSRRGHATRAVPDSAPRTAAALRRSRSAQARIDCDAARPARPTRSLRPWPDRSGRDRSLGPRHLVLPSQQGRQQQNGAGRRPTGVHDPVREPVGPASAPRHRWGSLRRRWPPPRPAIELSDLRLVTQRWRIDHENTRSAQPGRDEPPPDGAPELVHRRAESEPRPAVRHQLPEQQQPDRGRQLRCRPRTRPAVQSLGRLGASACTTDQRAPQLTPLRRCFGAYSVGFR